MDGHFSYLQEVRSEVRKRIVLWAEEALAETLVGFNVQEARWLPQATEIGAWLMVQL